MPITAVRRLQFCAGHRVLNHEGKCAHFHGHNYVVLVHAEAPALDDVGRVIDFSVLKERVGGWIDFMWDHAFIAFDKDDEAVRALSRLKSNRWFPLPLNPTAENLARYLLDPICPLVLEGTGVRVVKVEVWETENCKAEASL